MLRIVVLLDEPPSQCQVSSRLEHVFFKTPLNLPAYTALCHQDATITQLLCGKGVLRVMSIDGFLPNLALCANNKKFKVVSSDQRTFFYMSSEFSESSIMAFGKLQMANDFLVETLP